MLIPVFTVAENVELGHERTRGGASSTGGPRGARSRRSPSVRPAGAGRRARPGPPGRGPAAGRDHQGADPRRPGADPRRAHRGAHAPGDRRPDGRHAVPEGRRHVDRVHHPQAARGPGGRRPDHGHPARQGGRRGQPDRDLRGAGLDDGRPPGAARRSTRVPPSRRDVVSVEDLRVVEHAGQVTVDGVTFSCAPARSMPSPGCRATARPSSPRRWSAWSGSVGRIVVEGQRHHPGEGRRHPRPRGRLRPRGPPARRPGRQLHRRREPDPRHLRPPPFAKRHLARPRPIRAERR